MKNQMQKKQKRKREDSDDSDWSQIQKPGDSRIDKLIRTRNRYSIHSQKQDFISIPEENRIPLLPNQQIFDWQEQRRLLTVSNEINSRKYIFRLKAQQREQVLGQKDEVDNLVNNQWVNINKEEIKNRLRDESMKLLEGASNQSKVSLSKLDMTQLPDLPDTENFANFRAKRHLAFYNDSKERRKRGRPRKHPIKQPDLKTIPPQLLRFTLPQPPQQRASQISQRLQALPASSSKQIQKSRLIIAHQASQDEESMDISIDLQDDYEESYFNERKT